MFAILCVWRATYALKSTYRIANCGEEVEYRVRIRLLDNCFTVFLFFYARQLIVLQNNHTSKFTINCTQNKWQFNFCIHVDMTMMDTLLQLIWREWDKLEPMHCINAHCVLLCYTPNSTSTVTSFVRHIVRYSLRYQKQNQIVITFTINPID